MELLKPSEIPLSFFYFGYKKAKHYVEKETSFCDFLDIKEFEKDLDKNIKAIKSSFESNTFAMKEGTLYWFPKAKDKNGKPRMRPKVLFSFEDQVAWATVMLVLGEWFDTNPRLKEVYSVDEVEKRKALDWMVPWSLNNRLKRIHTYDNIQQKYKRTFIHFNGSSLYESFQWGLHQRNQRIKQSVENILEYQDKVYIGEADIREFYPSLKVSHIISTFNSRFKELEKVGIIDEQTKLDWVAFIENITDFKLIFLDRDTVENTGFYNEYKEYIFNEGSERDLTEILSTRLPLDLISSGFLANIVLTEHVDRRIEELLLNKDKIGVKGEVKLIRYTDDITVIASEEESVEEIIKMLEKFVNDIGLEFAPEKMVPMINKAEREKITEKIEEIIETQIPNDVLKNQLRANMDNMTPKVLTKNDKLPGSTAMIEKMSQISDVQIQTMDNDEIGDFITEMVGLLNLNVDPNEVKDETKVTFASWRIKKGLKEAMTRAIEVGRFAPERNLRKSLAKFPHKISLFEIYTLYLIDKITIKKEQNKEDFHELSDFLLSLCNSKEINNLREYGPFIRSKVLMVISKEWVRIPPELRGSFRSVINEAVQSWYGNNLLYNPSYPALWYERYSVYWCYIVIQLSVDPKFKLEKYKGSQNIYKSLNALKGIYEFRNLKTENNQEKMDGRKLYLLSSLFTQSIYFCPLKKELLIFDEDLGFFLKTWKSVAHVFKNESTLNNEEKVNLWLSWARISPSNIPRDAFKLIDDIGSNLQHTSSKAHLEMISFINQLITLYFQKPKCFKHFYEWVENFKKETNCYKYYILQRFYNFGLIQMSMGIDGTIGIKLPLELSQYPQYGKNDETTLNARVIPLQDWFFYIKHYPFTDNKALRPLSEFEIMKLLLALIKAHNKQNGGTEEVLLLEYGFKVTDWWEFRKSLFSLESEEVEVGRCTTTVTKYNNEMFKHEKEYYFSLTLLSMLKGDAFSYGIIKPFFMYKWKDIQWLFTQSEYPSTTIASMLVNNLNRHRFVYKNFYKVLDHELLPYKKLFSKNEFNQTNYENWVWNYLTDAKKNVISESKNPVEMIKIDLDVFTGEGE
ncbi:reverse transcriptase domain-containing protein [Bacillus sp. FJAT-44742]|uniref:reverse transcriptase domain-containing protein n=1 Tax=Bacillus sp. FJAT-44742 TaxID=2014005 RepID=UPI000C237A4B|nr:reverse transcriptase domain-containing protein [Bacillus sp. FJAT-44742]